MKGGSKALLIARLRLLDAVRDRRAFITGLLLPLVMLGAFAVIGLLGVHQDEKDRSTTLKVAVAARTAGADRLLASLADDGLRIVRSSEGPSLVVRQRADVELSLPADTDATLAAGRELRVEILAGPGGRSAEAVASTEAALHRAVLDAGGRPLDVRVSADRLVGNNKAVASALARTVPLLALVISLPFLSSGVRALANTRVDRSIEHLLPLPVARTTLLLGLAAGTIGGEAVQQVLLLGVLAVAAPALAAAGAIPWSGPPVLALALVVTAVSAGSVGILIGVVARSERIVGLMTGITGTALFTTATVLQFIDKPPRSPAVMVVPLIGPVLACRAAFTPDGLHPSQVLAMLAGGVVATAIALRVAAKRLTAGQGLRV